MKNKIIGNFKLNQIYCIDYLEGLKALPNKSIDAIITDPPYFFETHGRGFSGLREKLFTGLKDIGTNKNNNLVTDLLLSELLRVCKIPNIFIFCNKAQILGILKFAEMHKLNSELIPLCKSSPMPLSNNQWLPDREWGIHLFKNLAIFGDYSTKKGFFLDGNYQQEKYNHPSVKPEYIIRRIVKNITKESMVVLDCFMGSGTTAVVCKALGRDFLGFEINEEYCKIGKKRLSQEILRFQALN